MSRALYVKIKGDSVALEIVCERNYNRDGKHVYFFGIDESNVEKPFVLGNYRGMGIGQHGGETNLSLSGLVSWEHDWREHLKKSGCLPWIIEAIESADQENNVNLAIDKLLHAGGRWK